MRKVLVKTLAASFALALALSCSDDKDNEGGSKSTCLSYSGSDGGICYEGLSEADCNKLPKLTYKYEANGSCPPGGSVKCTENGVLSYYYGDEYRPTCITCECTYY